MLRLMFGQDKAFERDDQSPDRDSTVRNVKDGPDPKIKKIDHMAIKDPIDQIAERPTEDQ